MIFIKNATINTITEGIIIGNLLIENKKIKEIGNDIAAPLDATVIDAKGCLVLPGFIDAHTHLGLWEDGMGTEGIDGNEQTDPITPQLNTIDAINPMDITFNEAVKSGITSVCSTPGSANPIGGQAIALKTYGKIVDKMVIKNPVATKIAFGENPKNCYGGNEKTPQTRMSIAALIRETLRKAQEYLDGIEKSQLEEDYTKKPEYNMKYESLIPVLKREIPLKAHAHRVDDMFTAIRIAKEFDLKLTLDHCTEGHLVVDELIEEGYPILVGPSLTERSKIELRNLTFETAGILSNNGLNVCLITDHPVTPIQYLPLCAGIAIKHGMKEEKALEAITINPAKVLGIDNRVGSIEVGKDADIVIWDNNPFEINSNVLYTIIDGKIVYKKI